MLTADELQSIMPGLQPQKKTAFISFLQTAMTEFAIEAPARAAAFLAQLAHESGQFRFMEEIWGPTDAQERYEPPGSLATRLGNTQPGDGKRFKGRGPIQITGRANYKRFGDLLNVDLVGSPTRAAEPDLAFRIAGCFWSKKGLNELADQATADAFREITRRINGGFNGLAERQKFYAAACKVLGVAAPPLARGAREPFAVPDTAEEPVFDRGYDAVRAARRTRKAAPSAKKKRPRVTRKTRRRTASRRKTHATPAARRRSSSKQAATIRASKRPTAGSPPKSRTRRRQSSRRKK